MKKGKRGTAAAAPAAARAGRPAPQREVTPARAVVNLALLLFLPALLLVVDGNLSVQTALLRFGGALVVSWLAAWVVLATVRSARTGQAVDGTTDPAEGKGAGEAGAAAGLAGRTEPGATEGAAAGAAEGVTAGAAAGATAGARAGAGG